MSDHNGNNGHKDTALIPTVVPALSVALPPMPPALALGPDPDAKPWYRLSAETGTQYHAFCHYRDCQPVWQRSMRRAFFDHLINCKKVEQLPKNQWPVPPDWNLYRTRFAWVERSRLYDNHLEGIALKEREAEVKAMNQRHASLALGLQNLVVARLQAIQLAKQIPTMSPRDLAIVTERAVRIERMAKGMATQIVATDAKAGDQPIDLTHLSDDELALFEGLLAKARQALEP